MVEQLRMFQPDPATTAPVAVGGGMAADPYLIPSQMASVVLNECGYCAINLGPNSPTTALLAAVAKYRPALVWLSLTSVGDIGLCAQNVREFSANLAGIPLVVGGRHAASVALIAGPTVHVVGSMCELAAFSRALVLRRPSPVL
jgi:hypothetical protein